jgi:hypothetical protein
LALRKGADIAYDELIAIRSGFCDAIGAGGTAGPTDVLNDHRLMKLSAQAIGQYPRDHVTRAAS